MENTQRKTNETLKPEQMESGKWYFVKIVYDWLLKFDYYEDEVEPRTFAQRIISLDDGMDYSLIGYYTGGKVENIRPATNEEVLKYFPDEKFENVSLINEVNNSQVTEQQNQIESEKVEVDWKAKFEELQKDYDNLNFTYQNFMKIYEEQDLAYDALADKYSKLEAYNDELTEKINETETKNNQEKVYFYLDKERNHWRLNIDKQIAIDDSENHKEIYESVKIGVKKSVLVNE